ncbi:hypothetical protein [Elizabethkingia anophelis]|uniref:hypothetical protein n=1 Tax=Elizabethkingia anophelis TaxID=1117645 RepID=UPI001EE6D8B9|nr:hypothetical protein [Elizabethkingia anophelis]MCT3856002.1 hypothetical protein [Elizabethkingia anophelis]UKY82214.1 hypothetical protein KUF66_14445 [Elizabethkingia anophelis]UKY92849.1 hypothetical protein KUF67_14405 [Elizabethkingia anophelis]
MKKINNEKLVTINGGKIPQSALCVWHGLSFVGGLLTPGGQITSILHYPAVVGCWNS